MNTFVAKLTRLLPVSGLLFLVSVYLRGMVIDPVADPAMFVAFVGAPTFQVGALLNLFNFILLFAGVMALGLWVVDRYDSMVSKLGMILFFISHSLTLCYLGLLATAYHKSGELAVVSGFGILDLFNPAKNTALLPVIITDSATYFFGIVFTAIAMFKSKSFSAATIILFALSFIMVGVIPPATVSSAPIVARVSELAGNALILISGMMILGSVKKHSLPSA